MDPFNRLPAELIQEIISQSADFIGTEGLLLVSPRVHAVFHAQPRWILLDLMASNSITQIPTVHKLCRNIALIRHPLIHCLSLEDYQNTCETTPTLPEHMNTAELLQILHIAAHIQRLTCICLSTMHQNLISAIQNQPEDLFSGPLPAQRASEPFCWIEQYRVSWALWHLQHCSDLQTTAKHRWNWPAESLRELDPYLVWNAIDPTLAEQIWTVSAVLADLGLHPSYQTPDLHSLNLYGALTWLPNELLNKHNQEPPLPTWHYPDETPLPFFDSLQLSPANTHPYTRYWSPPPVPNYTLANSYWGRTPRRCDRRSSGAMMFKAYGSRMSRHSPPNYGMWEMRLYRRLGATIWDPRRLHLVGLFDCNARARMRRPDRWIIEGLSEGHVQPRSHAKEIQARWLALVGKRLVLEP
ncbi:hypothetical protein BDW59DRAFT_149221 [Aspergillus cavernicola]|uniref:F-box domain-containing protein n=1 Tax=Aspergillus cavernicola TaxID=176166 RepID=A0ABR4I4Y8_9EURO